MSSIEVALSIAIAVVTTMLTRFISFILFSRQGESPAVIKYLGNVLPAAVMGLLVVYSLKDVQPLAAPYGIPELIGVLVTIKVHFWRKNMLLSLGVGTVLYMLLVQTVFV